MDESNPADAAELGIEPVKSQPVDVVVPPPGQVFDGTATGTFDPPSPPPPTIVCKFWKTANTGGAPDRTKNATITGRMSWTVTFDNMSGVGETEEGVVRAEKGQDQDEHANLSWSPPNIAPPAKVAANAGEGKDGEKAGAAQKKDGGGKDGGKDGERLAPVLITRPRHNGRVARLFHVQGNYIPGDRNRVEVRVFRDGGKYPALALVLPTIYPAEGKFVTGVLAYESGEDFLIEATLRKKNGEVIKAHSVYPIKIV